MHYQCKQVPKGAQGAVCRSLLQRCCVLATAALSTRQDMRQGTRETREISERKRSLFCGGWKPEPGTAQYCCCAAP